MNDPTYARTDCGRYVLNVDHAKQRMLLDEGGTRVWFDEPRLRGITIGGRALASWLTSAPAHPHPPPRLR